MSATAALNSSINRRRIHHLHHLRRHFALSRIRCSVSNPRGFGPADDNVKKRVGLSKEQKDLLSRQRKSVNRQSGTLPGQAPGLSSQLERNRGSTLDRQFEERLEGVRRSAIQKKKEEKEFGAIDYDAPVEAKESTIGLGTKIGVGVAVVAFGLVFAFGDFLPSGSISTIQDEKAVSTKLSNEESSTLEARLQQYEAILGSSPKDLVALQGAAVTYAELGRYANAASLLEDLTKDKPNDPDVFRLLGEVRYELKEYEASAAAYKICTKMLGNTDFEILRGLTNALFAAKKPDEAVQVLVEARKRLHIQQVNDASMGTGGGIEEERSQVDPVQVDLLLGKAYSDWGHVSDAISVYDQLISDHPNDFRGFLAKGIILKENGNFGDAERMFIQARFFAPEKAKALVDHYSRR
ncbi:hypothetical protein Dimus_003590 [Dionaea muscipula]